MVVKTCKECGLERPHRRRSDTGKVQGRCKECLAAYCRRWRRENWQRRKVYDTWKGMIARCHDPETRRWHPGSGIPSYRDYGDRGIHVCRRWREPGNGFANFLEDMGLPPEKDSTLDRINAKRNYSKSNCRWTDPHTQNLNRRGVIQVTAHHPDTDEELTLSLAGWAKVYGLKPDTVQKRVRRGWDALRAISEPVPQALELAGVPF